MGATDIMKDRLTLLRRRYSPVIAQECSIGGYAEEPGLVPMHREQVRRGPRQIPARSILRCSSCLPCRILLPLASVLSDSIGLAVPV